MEKCNVCGKEFKSRRALSVHSTIMHGKTRSAQPQQTQTVSQPTIQPNLPTPSPSSIQPVTQYFPTSQSQNSQLTVEDIENIVERVLERKLGFESNGHSEFLGREVQIRPIGMPRSVPVSPIVQFYYEYTNSNGGEYKNLTEFIDDVVTEHFSECLGLELSVIKRKAFERGRGVSRWVR